MKSGFIAIVGRPNVGKSTLLNAVLKEKIAITSSKPQTTRNTIRGIYSAENLQMIFLDTPGIHKSRNKLGSMMTNNALSSLSKVDLVLFIVDDLMDSGLGDKFILQAIERSGTSAFLIINKNDILDINTYKRIYEEYDSRQVFKEIIGISAKLEKNIDVLLRKIESVLPEGPAYFPEGMITDHSERFIISEIIREKLLHYLEQEVPHGVAVSIDSFKEGEKCIDILATIFTEKKSHKGIIIGKGGRKLKGIGKSARMDIEEILGMKVYLELWVKVKENWRDSDFLLSNLGYREE